MEQNEIYYNTSKDVYHHLAVEKYLLDTIAPRSNILYIWQSSSAVVIGKNQNVWKECDYKVCVDNNIKIARRISGGGAVYQDPGNLNLSFISSKDAYNLDSNFTILLKALKNFGIIAERNQNNNLTVKGKKISGSSFCIKKNAVLHHASLLVNADLPLLYEVLQPSFSTIESRSVESHHSEVINCKTVSPEISAKKLINKTAREFRNFYGTTKKIGVNQPKVSLDQVHNYYMEITDNAWNFGRNPFWNVIPEDDGYEDKDTLVSILNHGKINSPAF